jgi:putative PEP-CTERM system TPR-repeat lipoprotein
MKGFNTTKISCGSVVLVLVMLTGCGKQSSDEYIQQSNQYIAENNSAAAVVALKNAVQVEPKSANARFALGQLYLQLKQFDSAEKELNRALDFGYDPSKVLPLLTQAYQSTGAYSAISKLEHSQAGLTAVERAEIGYFKVVALVRLNKTDEARLLIEDISSIDTSSVFKGLTAAYIAVLDSEFEKAATEVMVLRDQSPQNAEVLKLLAQLKLSLNQPKEATEIFKDYVQFYPDDKQTKFVLAKLLVDLGEMDAAEPYIDELLVINEQNALLHQLKAATRAFNRDYASALKRAEIAITNGIEDPSLRLIAGYAAYEQEDFSGANRHLSFIAGILPDNHPGLKLLAASQLQLGLTSEASDVLQRLDKLTEQDAPLFSKASYELLRDGYEKDAKVLVERSTNISRTAEDLTRLGLLQLSLNNLDGIVNLEAAVAQSPQLASAQITLVKAYLATGKFDKALELTTNWKIASPKDESPYLLAGDVHTRLQNYVAAQTEFEQALAMNPSNPASKLGMANLQIVQNKLSESKQLLSDLLIEFPTNIPALATYYMLNKRQGDGALGIKKIESALKSEKENIELRLLLARALAVEEEYVQVIELLAVVKEQKNLPKSYYKILGQSLIRTNQRRPANQHYDQWLAMEPNDKDANLGKLLLLDNQNKFADGTQLIETFLSHRDDVQMQLLSTHFLLMQADYAAAKKSYDKLPDNVLEQPICKGFLARFQLNDGNPEVALTNAEIAYKAAPNNRNLILLLFVYDTLKQSESAMTLLKGHVEKYPKDLAARMLVAERQLAFDLPSAMNTYRIALEQQPDNYIANNNLAYLYLQQGDVDKAKPYGHKAVELQPENAAALDTLAQIYMAEKDYEEALELYDRAITDAMQNEEIYLNYIEALLAAKKLYLAERKLSQREMKEDSSVQRVKKLKADYYIN